jgi:SAM-dependent methyltransferase
LRPDIDIRSLNRVAWNRQVELENRWTIAVTDEVIERAREGEWHIVLTPTRPIPREWFPDLNGARVLCLASGGGQQGPVLAAAGAEVIVFDNSTKQLDQDRMVADRHRLGLDTVEGDMTDLGVFSDGRFDLIVHPVSNVFVPDVQPVWKECQRVLRPGGVLMAGFVNPVLYLFAEGLDAGCSDLRVTNSIPYSDLDSLTDEQRDHYVADGTPFEFGHSLEDLIAGQISAGFVITGFFEDRPAEAEHPLSRFIATFAATRAVKA